MTSNRKRTTRNLQHWEYSTISRNQIWPRSRSRRWERLNREPRCCRGIYKLPESHSGEREGALFPFQQPALPLFSWYEYIVILDNHLTFYCFLSVQILENSERDGICQKNYLGISLTQPNFLSPANFLNFLLYECKLFVQFVLIIMFQQPPTKSFVQLPLNKALSKGNSEANIITFWVWTRLIVLWETPSAAKTT